MNVFFMGNRIDTKALVDGYRSFDDYLNSGRFAKLSQDEMTAVYDYFQKHHRLDRVENRRPLVLDSRRTLDGEPIEDLSIIQPDGSRACVNWELNNGGFQILG